MRSVFFGTPRFAEVILERLISAGYAPAALVCNPDRPVGRKRVLMAPPTKRLIAHVRPDIPVLQPEKIDGGLSGALKGFDADLFIVAAYAKILPRELIELPARGTLGIHPSLLPKFRGVSPIQSAILAGEAKTGTTIFLIDEKADHGPILTQKEVELLGGETTPELTETLARTSAELLLETLNRYMSGEVRPREQEHGAATMTKKIRMEDAYISPEDLARAEKEGGEIASVIERKVRAFNPEPGVWTVRSGRRLKLLEAISTPNGKLKLLVVQAEGGKPRRLDTDWRK
ncbi:MAG: methionyl-tRNA formyltransferase [Candidatus Colwellbacteria bacterium]|nr:methionyl-tRNA formyltransferase [Candidatus Colwellbacteria bacterium]